MTKTAWILSALVVVAGGMIAEGLNLHGTERVGWLFGSGVALLLCAGFPLFILMAGGDALKP